MTRAALALAAAAIASCQAPPPSVAPAPSPTPPAAPVASAIARTTEPGGAAAVDAGAPPSTDGGLAPLVAPVLETVHAGDFDVVVAAPAGARERRPVVVGIHGSKDRPDAACARWRRSFAGWAFVVCPAGVPYRGGLAWGSPLVMIERIERALGVLRERHGAYVAEGPAVYAGWSLGGTRGPGVVATRPGLFEPVVLAEVGHTRLDATTSVASLRKGRAAHAIVACATRRCAAFTKRLERAAGGRGPSIAAVDAGIGRGHLFDETMARSIGRAFVTTVAGDPRWTGFDAALEAPPTEDAGTDAPLPLDDDEPEP